jgi:hypothetical protein
MESENIMTAWDNLSNKYLDFILICSKFYWPCLSSYPFSFGHCIIYPCNSSFWLPLFFKLWWSTIQPIINQRNNYVLPQTGICHVTLVKKLFLFHNVGVVMNLTFCTTFCVVRYNCTVLPRSFPPSFIANLAYPQNSRLSRFPLLKIPRYTAKLSYRHNQLTCSDPQLWDQWPCPMTSLDIP